MCFDVLDFTRVQFVQEFVLLFLHLMNNLIQAEDLFFSLQLFNFSPCCIDLKKVYSRVCQHTVASLVGVVTGATDNKISGTALCMSV